jgi:hypothetical protein
MAITHLATAVGNPQATSLIYTLTAGQSIPAGSTIHVAAVAQAIGAAPTCSDNVNGAYALDDLEAAGNLDAALFRFSNNAALGSGDAVTVTFDASTFNRIVFVAWSDDLDLSSPLDQAPVSDDGNSTTPSTGGQTLVNDAVRWLGVLGLGDNVISTFNEDPEFTGLASTDANNRAAAYAYRDVAAAETNDYAPTLDAAVAWVDILAAYKKAGGGPAAARNLMLLGVGS